MKTIILAGGPGDLNWSRIAAATTHNLLAGQRPMRRSDCRPIRDHMHVRDMIAAYLPSAEATIERPTFAGGADVSAQNLTPAARFAALYS